MIAGVPVPLSPRDMQVPLLHRNLCHLLLLQAPFPCGIHRICILSWTHVPFPRLWYMFPSPTLCRLRVTTGPRSGSLIRR